MKLINNVLYLNHYDFTGLRQLNISMYNFLVRSLSSDRDNIIKPHPNVRDDRAYLQGFMLYLNACNDEPPTSITEQDIYHMAVVAYEWNNVAPLLKLAELLRSYTDVCYWLYLAYNQELFRSTMEVEIYRRKTYLNPELKLADITNRVISYRPFPDYQSFMFGQPKYINQSYRIIDHTKFHIDTPDKHIETIISTGGNISNNIIKAIAEIEGVVIVGGTLTLLRNRVIHKVNLMTLPDSLLSYLGFDPETLALVRNLLATPPNLKDGRTYLDDLYETDDSGLFFEDGTLYYNIYPRVDAKIRVYFLNEAAIDQVFELIAKIPGQATYYQLHEMSTQVNIHINDADIVRIQLVKKVYPRVRTILANIDLDSERLAYYRGMLIATDSYIKAHEYGINVIVPSRQHKCYNEDLSYQRMLGFEPVLLGGLKEHVTATGSYTYSELLDMNLATDDRYYKRLGISRYDSRTFEYDPVDFTVDGIEYNVDDRFKAIAEGQLQPTIYDIMSLVNIDNLPDAIKFTLHKFWQDITSNERTVLNLSQVAYVGGPVVDYSLNLNLSQELLAYTPMSMVAIGITKAYIGQEDINSIYDQILAIHNQQYPDRILPLRLISE